MESLKTHCMLTFVCLSGMKQTGSEDINDDVKNVLDDAEAMY